MVEKIRMKKEFFDKWIEALKSGKYTQSTDFLYNESSDGYCCLGVACSLMGIDDSDLIRQGVPKDIAEKLEDIEEFPKVLLENESFVFILARLNDSGEEDPILENPHLNYLGRGRGDIRYSFEEIAEFLEKNIETY